MAINAVSLAGKLKLLVAGKFLALGCNPWKCGEFLRIYKKKLGSVYAGELVVGTPVCRE
jgi:hypothetical protein